MVLVGEGVKHTATWKWSSYAVHISGLFKQKRSSWSPYMGKGRRTQKDNHLFGNSTPAFWVSAVGRAPKQAALHICMRNQVVHFNEDILGER